MRRRDDVEVEVEVELKEELPYFPFEEGISLSIILPRSEDNPMNLSTSNIFVFMLPQSSLFGNSTSATLGLITQ